MTGLVSASSAGNTISAIQTRITRSRSHRRSILCSHPASAPRASTQGAYSRSRTVAFAFTLISCSYLRPETAQGHFLNFSRLLDYNNGRLPFASAAIGRSFRNEISPRAGLLRVREFTMAEIEHYVDPTDKSHAHFKDIANVELALLDKHTQASGRTEVTKKTIGAAVSEGTVANETLGYFLARIYQFLTKIGVDPARLRFRQHMENEMAHYATDCWDAEILTSMGWIECVGCADRAAYDLTVHAKRTGAALVVRQALKEPIVTERETPEFNKKVFGKTFGKDAGAIQAAIGDLDEASLLKIKGELAQG
jgi:glycyl-tRNA synthetase